MRNASIFSLQLIFFDLIPLKKVGQCVCNSVGLFLTIIDLKMVPKELLGLPDLTRAQALYIHEPKKVVMVG